VNINDIGLFFKSAPFNKENISPGPADTCFTALTGPAMAFYFKKGFAAILPQFMP
jgi:hypothetical protein